MKTYGFETITVGELKEYFNSTPEKDYLLIDVRQPEEYFQNHIPGASLISVPELASKLSQLPKDKDFVFYCDSGSRSRIAAMMTADENITQKHIYHLEGGIDKWSGASVSGIPKIGILDKAKTFYQFLMAALALEKGAQLLYLKISDLEMLSSGKDILKTLANEELSHAGSFYDLLINYSDPPPKSFEKLYQEISGDIIEGGDALEDLFKYIHTIQKYGCIKLLNLALDVEFASYDLYRSMVNLKTEEKKTADKLLMIAQTEKDHMRRIAETFVHCKDA